MAVISDILLSIGYIVDKRSYGTNDYHYELLSHSANS